ETYAEITANFAHWDDIDIHYKGSVITSTGHGFSGLSRQKLLNILQERGRALGVSFQFEKEGTRIEPIPRSADLVLAADGANSFIRQKYAAQFGPQVEARRNKFVWLGTTRPFPAFTFYFKESEHGVFRVHAYQYEKEHSTFIVE